MTQTEALCELLAIEDADDARRAHYLTVEGDPERMTTIYPALVRAWISTQLSERDQNMSNHRSA